MYNPPQFKVEDLARLKAFVLANSFATVVSADAQGAPLASHLPLHIYTSGEQHIMAGHFAKANPHWRELDGRTVLAIFHGPHAYVSPTNYENNAGIPTWNYVAVHARGTARVMHETAQKLAVLHRMYGKYETQVRHDFEVQSDKFQEGQLAAIVAFEFEIIQFEGKFKLNQNRSPADQSAVADWLTQSPNPVTRATGELMKKNL